jgi:hypothetical protein
MKWLCTAIHSYQDSSIQLNSELTYVINIDLAHVVYLERNDKSYRFTRLLLFVPFSLKSNRTVSKSQKSYDP